MKGIITPLITPLLGRDALDHAGLEKLIERLITGGVHGLFIIGTTGEGPSLSYRLRHELITETCKRVDQRVPVFVGITDTAFVESVNIARHSADAGADAVVAAPPYYLPEAQPELLEYIRHLLPEMPLPLFLYNMPSLTKVSFDIDTVRALQDETQIHGIKDSSGNMVYFHRLCQLLNERPDWSVLMGPEELLLDAVLAGGHGGVNGGANIFPELYVALYDAAVSGNLVRARELHALVMRISATLYQVGRHSSAIIKGIKCALSHLGVCDDFIAEPFHRFRDVERNRIAEALTLLNEEVSNLVP
jgi:dihydrodipicolinate synthase/N-acetylneuraminate lyase